MTRTRKWVMGTALAALAILVAGWFLLISPKKAEAADLNTQAAAQIDTNMQMRTKIAQLQAQAKGLPQQQAKLANIRVHIPDNPAMPALVRSLSKIASQTNVIVRGLSPAVPTAVVSDPGAAQAAALAASGETVLEQVTLGITVEGGYFDLERFFNKVEALPRSVLVTGFDITLPDSTSTNGSASSADGGTRKAVINARVFLVSKPAAPAAPTGAAASAAPSASASPAQ